MISFSFLLVIIWDNTFSVPLTFINKCLCANNHSSKLFMSMPFWWYNWQRLDVSVDIMPSGKFQKQQISFTPVLVTKSLWLNVWWHFASGVIPVIAPNPLLLFGWPLTSLMYKVKGYSSKSLKLQKTFDWMSGGIPIIAANLLLPFWWPGHNKEKG